MSLSPIRKVMLGRVHNLIVTVVNTEKFYLIKRCIERIYEQKSSAAFPPTKPGLTSSIFLSITKDKFKVFYEIVCNGE